MKKIFLILTTVLLVTALWAKPARRTLTTLTQPDGTRIQAIWSGDEFYQFYTDASTNERLTCDEQTGYWRAMTQIELAESSRRWQERRAEHALEQRQTGAQPRFASKAAESPTLGYHRLPCLLVNWSDLSFSDVWKKDSLRYSNINDLFQDMMNGGEDYRFEGAAGAVNQYFYDQSYGKYEAEFDIIGPINITARYNCDKNHTYTTARKAWIEALDSAYAQGYITDEMIDLWDNDGDGYVDLLYVYYAGYNSAQGDANRDYVWPHQWGFYGSLSKRYGNANARFLKYSCSSELMSLCTERDSEGNPLLIFDAIGSATHEFGHALGLPDFYNTTNNGGDIYGMLGWSNMDVGCYNCKGHYPPSYNTFERLSLGWVTPLELPDSGTVVLPPFDNDTICYILRNPANPNEFLTFDCHQYQGWDTYYGQAYFSSSKFTDTHGLLVTHVDYDESTWYNNSVNTDPGHQRCIPMPADGKLYSYEHVTNSSTLSTFKTQLFSDLFPGKKKISGASAETNPEMHWWTTHYDTIYAADSSSYQRKLNYDPIDLVISNVQELPDGSISMDVIQPRLHEINAIDRIIADSRDEEKARLIRRDSQLLIRRGEQYYDLRGMIVR